MAKNDQVVKAPMAGASAIHGVDLAPVKIAESDLCNTHGNNEERIRKTGSSEHEIQLDCDDDGDE